MELREALKEKVHNAFAEQRFVGEVRYSENEYQELLDYTSEFSRFFANGIGSYLRGDDEMHFTTLVEIAKRWKNDEDNDTGYWRYVLITILGVQDNQKMYIAYTDLINGLIFRKKILWADDVKKKYYATIMMHAFAPDNSINSFLDLAYYIYKKDLDFDYTSEDSEICEIATRVFCDKVKNLSGENAKVAIGAGAFGIKIGLRCMALGKDTQIDFIKLLDTALCSINKLYRGQSLDSNDYFSSLIANWWQTKSDKDLAVHSVKREFATTKQNITAKFVYQNDEAYLRIPPIRFASGEKPMLRVSIFNEDNAQLIKTENISTRIGEITITSVKQDYSLNEILLDSSTINIRVEISDAGKTIFRKVLKREYVLFESEEEILGNILKPSNYFLYTPHISGLQLPVAVSTIAKNLYNIYPTDGESITGENRHTVFVDDIKSLSSSNKMRLIGSSNICKWKYEEREHKVFAGKIILIVPEGTSINSLELRINKTKTLLSEKQPVADGGFYLFDITDNIAPYKSAEVTIYSYLKEKETLCENVVLISKLQIAFSKPIYYGDDEKSVKVSVGSQYRNVTWNLGDEEAVCAICSGRLLISIPLLKWRIDNQEWNYGATTDTLWYKDYFDNGSVLEVSSPFGDIRSLQLYCIIDGKVQEVPLNAYSKYDIGKCIYANEKHKSLKFILTTNLNQHRFEICRTTTISGFLNNPPFVIINGKVRFTGEQTYVGEKVPFFTILFQCIGKNDISFKSTDLLNGVIEKIEENNYWVKITAPSQKLFVKEESILWEGEYIFGDSELNKLKNKVFKIKPICGPEKGSFWKVSKDGYYISKLIRETQNVNNGVYFCTLFYKSSGGECASVCGFSECRIEIISEIALKIAVKDENGQYTLNLKCNPNGELYKPTAQSPYTAHNYHFIEVKNV